MNVLIPEAGSDGHPLASELPLPLVLFVLRELKKRLLSGGDDADLPVRDGGRNELKVFNFGRFGHSDDSRLGYPRSVRVLEASFLVERDSIEQSLHLSWPYNRRIGKQISVHSSATSSIKGEAKTVGIERDDGYQSPGGNLNGTPY